MRDALPVRTRGCMETTPERETTLSKLSQNQNERNDLESTSQRDATKFFIFIQTTRSGNDL